MKFSLWTLILFMSAANAAVQTTQNVVLKNGKNEVVGTATLTQLTKGVKVELDLHGLAPGSHALHFHEKGTCQPPKFESAGGHFEPANNKHGFDVAAGPHAGDMPNILVGVDGTVKLEIVHAPVGLKANSLLKPGGTALVIHEKADDYKSQPSGDAGGRLACGEIKGT